MTFKKGQSGCPTGKPKGTLSPKTKAWEELGEYIANAGARRYLKALEQLNDAEYVNRFEHVLEYFKPKLARSEVSGPNGKDLFPTDVNKAKEIVKTFNNAA